MQLFLDAIEEITRNPFEQHTLFRLADHYIENYHGASWQDLDVNGRYITYPDLAKRVRLVNPDNYCSVETDPKSAGAALSIMYLNHQIWKANDIDPNGEAAEKFSELWETTMDAVRSDSNLDQRAINAFLD